MRCLIMGAPGSGKGTYADGIRKHYAIPHISTGEIFREAIAKETPMGILAKSYIDKGHLCPDELTNEIVKERLLESDCLNGFVLDGYPRTINQAIALDKTLREIGVNLDMVVNLFVEEELIISRISNRRICPTCGRTFNLLTLKPVREGLCDECHSELFQRKDDNAATVKSRLDVYYNQTQPLIEYYEAQNILLQVDGSGVADIATKRVIKAMEDFR